MRELLDKRSEKLKKVGLKKQPLILFVGDNRIEKNYIFINEFFYVLGSAKRTISVTFKNFFSLQLAYPKEAYNPWLLIQYMIYDMRLREIRCSPPERKNSKRF